MHSYEGWEALARSVTPILAWKMDLTVISWTN